MNEEFERGLREITASSSIITRQIGSYILDSGGKRLRPKLVLLVGEAVGLSREAVMPLAYSVELLHTASLLHDDVVDGTEIRRSRATANQVFGDKPALLVGDFLSASALDIVFSLGNVQLGSLIVKTIKRMAEGELLEIERSLAFHDNLEVYFNIIYLKTASLFELCAIAPGIMAGLSGDLLSAIAKFGRNIGMAFQVVDDIINLVPDTHDDKDAFNDIAERKSTLPLIHLFQDKPELLERLKKTSKPQEWQTMIIPNLSPDILKKSREIAAEYLGKALDTLYGKSFFTESLSKIPSLVLAPIDARF